MIPGPLFSSSSAALGVARGLVAAAAVVGASTTPPPCSLCFSNHAADVPDG